MSQITYLINGRVVTPRKLIEPGYVAFAAGQITAVGPMEELQPPMGAEVIDVADRLVLPGLIDLHTHGYGGIDVETMDRQQFLDLAQHMLSLGVTAFLPTLSATDLKTMYERAELVRWIQGQAHNGANVLGIYFEAPYMNPVYRGAQALEHVRDPLPAEYLPLFDACGDVLRIVLIAPELPGAMDFIRECVRREIVPALGHCQPSYEVAKEAINAGADHLVHAFNAVPDFKKRDPGVIGAFLNSDHVYLEVISDGHHLHRAAVELLYKFKGPDWLILVSDSAPLTGLPDGIYRGFGQEIELRGFRATLAGRPDVLAGSASGLNRCLQFAVEEVGIPLVQAVQMATSTPAKRLKLTRKGRLEPGLDADLVVLNPDYSAALTFVGGQERYRQWGG